MRQLAVVLIIVGCLIALGGAGYQLSETARLSDSYERLVDRALSSGYASYYWPDRPEKRSIWPPLIGGGAVAAFGVLLLAILSRPQPPSAPVSEERASAAPTETLEEALARAREYHKRRSWQPPRETPPPAS
jgi:hypothetical protein